MNAKRFFLIANTFLFMSSANSQVIGKDRRIVDPVAVCYKFNNFGEKMYNDVLYSEWTKEVIELHLTPKDGVYWVQYGLTDPNNGSQFMKITEWNVSGRITNSGVFTLADVEQKNRHLRITSVPRIYIQEEGFYKNAELSVILPEQVGFDKKSAWHCILSHQTQGELF